LKLSLSNIITKMKNTLNETQEWPNFLRKLFKLKSTKRNHKENRENKN